MQSLRWGVWCPFQESKDCNGEEIQLRLHGGVRPNPYGVMVYSDQTSATALKSSPLSSQEAAQVIQAHTESICSGKQVSRMRLKSLIPALFSSYDDASLRTFALYKLFLPSVSGCGFLFLYFFGDMIQRVLNLIIPSLQLWNVTQLMYFKLGTPHMPVRSSAFSFSLFFGAVVLWLITFSSSWGVGGKWCDNFSAVACFGKEGT